MSSMETVALKPGHLGAPEGTLAAKLLGAGFRITLDLEIEDMHPRESLSECMSPDEIQALLADLENGNPWAWFCAKVTITDPASGMKGTDYLGACAGYTPETWFDPSGYWPDMVSMALDDLKNKAAAGEILAARLEKLAVA